MYNLSDEDKEFLKTYKVGDYERPSVTVDILIFTIFNNRLNLLLIKRKACPFKNKWAIPGGFLDLAKNETIEQAADRELFEETNIKGYLEQFGVFSEPDRDPRTRVISNGFVALVPSKQLIENMRAGDDAKEVELFEIVLDNSKTDFSHLQNIYGFKINREDLAFDHAEIIKKALNFLQQKLLYGNSKFIFFSFLNKDSFIISDLQRVYEAIKGEKLITSNFRRDFIKRYVKEGLAEETGELRKHQRPAKLYRLRGI